MLFGWPATCSLSRQSASKRAVIVLAGGCLERLSLTTGPAEQGLRKRPSVRRTVVVAMYAPDLHSVFGLILLTDFFFFFRS